MFAKRLDDRGMFDRNRVDHSALLGRQLMVSRPLVSVVTPCFNVAAYVGEAIRSVQGQTMGDWEMLLVDDGSTDRTLEICQDAASSDRRIRVFPVEENAGPAIARNYAIREARGRYVAFLDADDIWYEDKLEQQLEAFNGTGASLVYSSYDVMDEFGNEILRTVRAPATVRYRDFLTGCPIGCLTAAFDAGKLGKVYMPQLRRRQDWGLWMRVLRRDENAVGLPDSLAVLRIHGGSLTANKALTTYYTWRLLRDEAGLGPMAATYGVLRHLGSAAGRRLGAKRPAAPITRFSLRRASKSSRLPDEGNNEPHGPKNYKGSL
jgi:teichuronic acid biosynthesis glycosyltransferase TuaG